MEAEKAVQQKRREIRQAEMTANIALEEQNKELVALESHNSKQKADTNAYSVSAVMDVLAEVDPRVLQALASVGMEPGQLVALAFKEMAESADKIGQLNISPDLLRELMSQHLER